MSEVPIEIRWYQALVYDCQQLIEEAKEQIVYKHWQMGRRILQEEFKFGKPEYGSHTIENLANDLGISKRTIYYQIEFARKYPEFCNALQNLPWRHAIQLLSAKTNERKTKPKIPLLPEGKFDVIYADPPWRYEFSETESRSIEAHYDTLLLDEICHYKDPAGTPIQDKFADDAILFLWAPPPKLFESFSVIKEWGFDYRTCAVWVKDKIGMGYFFRQQHELLLVARKGNMPVPEPPNRPSSIIEAPRLNHSRKPDQVYEIIMKMYPRDRYLELFGRRQYNGKWVVFGVLGNAQP
jgi:N6-adenosine-specific RNA methylase IME4